MSDGLIIASETTPSNGRLRVGRGTVTLWPEIKLGSLSVEDIGQSLSKICRFNGHGNAFYSVAQHCVLVSYLVPPQYALQGHAHDHPEALTGDVTRPVKYLPELQGFRDLEHRLECEYFKHLGISYPLHPCVKDADNRAVAWEAYHLFDPKPSYARKDAVPSTFEWMPLSHDRAFSVFMNRYYQILDTLS